MRFNYLNLQLFGGSGNSSASSKNRPSRGQLGRLLTKDECINQIMSDTNSDKENAEKMNDAVYKYTDDAYTNIRDKNNHDYNKQRNSIEEYIAKAPTYNGDIYRGIQISEQDGNVEFLSQLKTGATLDMNGISSWSSDKHIGELFSKWNDRDEDYNVLLKCKNKSGVGIQHIARDLGEHEVLQSSKTKFKIKSVVVQGNKYEVEVEEI